MEWLELKTEKEIENLMTFYENFEDTLLIDFSFKTGNYVDPKELVSSEENINNLTVRFERLTNNPYAIEMLFEQTRTINCVFPFWGKDNWTAEIMYAKIVHNQEFYYWTNWMGFDPYKDECNIVQNCMLIEAYSIKWRVLE